MQRPRSLTLAAALLVVTLGLAFGLPGPVIHAQSAGDSLPSEPSERQVREAVEVLRLYLAAQRAERPRPPVDTQPEEATEPHLPELDQAGGVYAGVTSEDAPVLADASLSVDQQVHLAEASAVFKNDELFLWDDPTGMNIALGRGALSSTTGTATGNTAVGRGALQNTVPKVASNLYGSYNTAVGDQALYANTYGVWNTAIGFRALYASTSGLRNTATGYAALTSNTSGYNNTAIGHTALFANLDGHSNAVLGTSALNANTAGFSNTAAGASALGSNIDGSQNAAVGRSALFDNTSGDGNTALGSSALPNNTTGNDNIGIGRSAGVNAPVDASDNIFIGNSGDAGDSTPTIRIGTDDTQTRAFIAGIDGNVVLGTAVQVTAAGELGVDASSQRFKQAIEPLGDVGARLLALRPVTFRFDPQRVAGGGEARVGLIAEEVAAVFPELVTRDADGRPFSVRYDLLSVLLLDEYQRQTEDGRRLEQKLDEVLNRMATLERELAID